MSASATQGGHKERETKWGPEDEQMSRKNECRGEIRKSVSAQQLIVNRAT